MDLKHTIKKILASLRLWWSKSYNSSDDIKNPPIHEGETLSRFLFNRKEFSRAKKEVRAAAFMPNAKLQTSVFRKSRMSALEYETKKQEVALERERTLKGCALIGETNIRAASEQLIIRPDESKHRWHAEIEGWPSEKSERLLIANQIALNSSLE